jgi:thiol-disulfide isomerase/thioredoxin
VRRVAFALIVVMAAGRSPATRLRAAGTLDRASPSRAAGADPIKWRLSLDEASVEAQRTNRPMVIEFWADWCGYCTDMERDVYPDRQVAAAFDRVVPVRIDFDRQPPIARRYGVADLPAIVVTDSLGSTLLTHRGFLDAKTLTALLGSLPADVSAFNALSRALARNRNDFAALDAFGRGLRAAGFLVASTTYFERALSTAAGRAPDVRARILSDVGANWLEIEDGRRAAAIFRRCLVEFPRDLRREEWLARLAAAEALSRKRP